MSNFIIRKPYDRQVRQPVSNELPSLTEQHYKGSCDIGLIIANHMQTSGQLPPAPQHSYVDCTKIEEFKALNEEAQAQGMTLQQFANKIIKDNQQELGNEQNVNANSNSSIDNSSQEVDK